MNETEARLWMDAHVSRGTIAKIEQFVEILRDEAAHQNLVSAATLSTIWARHIVDSAQLLTLAPPIGRWIDLGSGAGFPGLIIALIGEHPVFLAESRTKRLAFLQNAIDLLGIRQRVSVLPGRIETLMPQRFDIISARAFAPLDRLFASAHHLADAQTRWILPKGRSAQAELDAVGGSWQGSFSIVPSITDTDAAIIAAENVRPLASVRRSWSRR